MELADIIHLIIGGDSDFMVVSDVDRERVIYDDRKSDLDGFMRFLKAKGQLKSYMIEARGNVIVIYI